VAAVGLLVKQRLASVGQGARSGPTRPPPWLIEDDDLWTAPAFLVGAAQTNKSPIRSIKADRALGEARGYATRSGSPLLKPNRRKSH